MSTNASPGFVLLDSGSNYLVRAASDNIFPSSAAALSVSITFDPTAVSAGTTGTIIGKFNAGNNQRSWKMSYDGTTGIVTVSLWSDKTAGTAAASRVSAAAVRVRSVVTFVYDGGGLTLDIYINGSLSNGALTGAVPATLDTSTEPIAIGADATSVAATNITKGTFHAAAIWNVVLSGAEVATILRDGVVPGVLNDVPHLPQLILSHTSIVQLTSQAISTWTDTSGNSRPLSGGFTSGHVPYAQQSTGGSILRSNNWDYTMTDNGLMSQGLTSTYTTSAPWALWGVAATQPQRPSFRSYQNDITIFVRARKVTGTTSANFIQVLGMMLQYTLSSKELFAIVGTDITNTLQNSRYSFGINLFPVEGTSADIAIRYNCVDNSIDVFIGSTKYTATVAASNSSVTATDIFLANNSDFGAAVVCPACLSDARVQELMSGLSGSVYSFTDENIASSYEDPAETVSEEDSVGLPDAAAAADTLVQDQALYDYSFGLAPFEMLYVNDPYLTVDRAKTLFVDPLPVITSLVVNGSHHATGVAAAGPTDAYETYNYWEIELTPGVSIIVIDQAVSTAFFAGRTTQTDQWDVPLGALWQGLQARFVIQAVQDSSQIWYSDWVTLTDSNWNNPPPIVYPDPATYTDPVPQITSVSVDEDRHVTAIAAAGPTEATQVLRRWEIELTVGEIYVIADETLDGSFNGSRDTVTDTFDIPASAKWNGKRIRFTVRNEDPDLRHNPEEWVSAWMTLNDPNFDSPIDDTPPTPPPVWDNATHSASDLPLIPVINIDLYDVTAYTLKAASVLWPLSLGVTKDLTLDPNSLAPQVIYEDAPAGLYTVRYVSGDRRNANTLKHNAYFPSAFGTEGDGLWIKSGRRDPYYVFQTPAFTTDGYDSSPEAVAAAVDYEFIFFHGGGDLALIWDIDSNVTYTGSVALEVKDVPGSDIPGYWTVVKSKSGAPVIDNTSAQLPTITGLARGETHLRYFLNSIDNKPRWQDVYLRVWPTPGTTDSVNALDPVQPENPTPLDSTGSAAGLKDRRDIPIPPKGSGNNSV